MYVRTYVRTYAHTYTYTYVCTYIICTHVCTHVHTYIHMYACTYVCTCIRTYIRTYICMYVYSILYIHTYVCTIHTWNMQAKHSNSQVWHVHTYSYDTLRAYAYVRMYVHQWRIQRGIQWCTGTLLCQECKKKTYQTVSVSQLNSIVSTTSAQPTVVHFSRIPTF